MKRLYDYTVVLRPDDNGTFVAFVPAIPGCHAWGQTPEEAQAELQSVFDMFQDLKDRGLSGVKLVISDGHKGIQKAVEKSFLGASWQICHVHLVRAVLRNVAKGYSQMFK
jgi:predicted RNase H-like HicB family nuclease